MLFGQENFLPETRFDHRFQLCTLLPLNQSEKKTGPGDNVKPTKTSNSGLGMYFLFKTIIA